MTNWSVGLVRDTGTILRNTTPDLALSRDIVSLVVVQGEQLHDLHLSRLALGHLGAIVSRRGRARSDDALQGRLRGRFDHLSHIGH